MFLKPPAPIRIVDLLIIVVTRNSHTRSPHQNTLSTTV
jgi:hypothetical protein